jgi:hypothetical protein
MRSHRRALFGTAVLAGALLAPELPALAATSGTANPACAITLGTAGKQCFPSLGAEFAALSGDSSFLTMKGTNRQLFTAFEQRQTASAVPTKGLSANGIGGVGLCVDTGSNPYANCHQPNYLMTYLSYDTKDPFSVNGVNVMIPATASKCTHAYTSTAKGSDDYFVENLGAVRWFTDDNGFDAKWNCNFIGVYTDPHQGGAGATSMTTNGPGKTLQAHYVSFTPHAFSWSNRK